MSAIPHDILSVLDRLNAHARATGRRGHWYGDESRAIYTYKTFAAWRSIDAGEAEVELIRWHGKCGHCSDGWFEHWDDGRKVRCRYCDGSAKVTLRFTETTLPGWFVWHHPWEGQIAPGFDLARKALGPGFYSDQAQWHEAGDWHPRAPGAELPLAELVPLINMVEDWIETQSERRRGEPWWWHDEAAFRALHLSAHRRVIGPPSSPYRLDLGRAPGGCFLCGSDDLEGFCFGRISDLFHWSLPVCKAHAKAPHPDGPPPETMITPALAQWRTRHERVVEVA